MFDNRTRSLNAVAEEMNDVEQTAASQSDFFSTAFMLGNVGAPFIIGLAVGYFAKKMLKLALFIGGAAIVGMFVAEYYGLFTIDDESLQHAANTATDLANKSGGFLLERLSQITTRGVSASVGFFAGLKLG